MVVNRIAIMGNRAGGGARGGARGGSSVSPTSGINYAGVSTSTKGWNAEMKSTYKAMTTQGGYSSKLAKQIINSQKSVYQGGGGGNDIPLF